MGDVKHMNIVTLSVYCSSSHINPLVYDLLQNGILDEILHTRSLNKAPLNWVVQHTTTLGSSCRIEYLHHY
jgi:hypothetical protein